MDKQLLIKEVKKQTGRADLEQALQLLDDFTMADPIYNALQDEVIHVKAQYAQLKKDQNAGVISFENAKISLNQITKQILAILDKLEREDQAVPPKPNRSKLIPLLLSAVVMVVLGVFGANWLMDNNDPTPIDPDPTPREEPQAIQTAFCNNFNEEDAEFRVLILPYFSINADEPLNTHNLIRIRLGNLSDQYMIKLESEIYADSTLAQSGERYPANANEAVALSKNCEVDLNLVIWGTEYKNADQQIITTKYKFLTGTDSFDLTKLKITNAGIVDTLQSLSSILTHGEVTGEIEDIIKYIFGIIKYETGDYDAAIAALEEAKVPKENINAQLTKNMLLFESHYQKGDKTSAMASLDEALINQSDFTFALNNRAAIYYEQGKTKVAVADLKEANKRLPKDATIGTNLLQATIKAEEIAEAKKTLNQLQRLDTKEDFVIRAPKDIENLEKRQEITLQVTKDVLKNDPDNVEALLSRAEIYLKNENFKASIKLANRILEKHPIHTEAYLILLEAYIKLDRKKEVVATIRRAQNVGLNKLSLLKGRDDLRRLVDEITLVKK